MSTLTTPAAAGQIADTAPVRVRDHCIVDLYASCDAGWHVATAVADEFEYNANRIANKLDQNAIEHIVSILHESIEEAVEHIIESTVERAFLRLCALEAKLDKTPAAT